MSKTDLRVPVDYAKFLKEVKARIHQAQTRAMMSVNAELLRLYWDIGRLLTERQEQEGWGAAVLDRLAADIRNELPDVKGFSRRNLFLMTQFFREYPNAFVQQPVALTAGQAISHPATPGREKVQQPVAHIPWAHNVLLLQKVKDTQVRLWYMQQTLANGWSRNVLLAMIQSKAHHRQGNALTNFKRLLPSPQSDLVQQTLKDPYLFDFLTIEEPFHERELETNLLRHLERFLLELGQGFAFVGRQLHQEVGDSDFYIDLLFYHLTLRCFVVIDLKKGAFKPEYAGKMNFYLSVVDDRLRYESDAPSIGLILCQDRNRIVAEYALRGVSKPIGISEYELTRALPLTLQSALPTVEEIEAELAESTRESAHAPKAEKPKATKAAKSARKKQQPKGRKT